MKILCTEYDFILSQNLVEVLCNWKSRSFCALNSEYNLTMLENAIEAKSKVW